MLRHSTGTEPGAGVGAYPTDTAGHPPILKDLKLLLQRHLRCNNTLYVSMRCVYRLWTAGRQKARCDAATSPKRNGLPLGGAGINPLPNGRGL